MSRLRALAVEVRELLRAIAAIPSSAEVVETVRQALSTVSK